MVSIILPNLNTNLHFLGERLTSISQQTYSDWECIVIDGFSNNGSWERLLQAAQVDSRFTCFQKPKRGIYNAWNEGIKLARGKYIYIATADDTMDPEFLAKMVQALEENPMCDIAHCCLTIIDENGNNSANMKWHEFPPALFFGKLIDREHIRMAPHDGLLHAFVKTVYHSITQLLIRKNVFDELGFFKEDGGTIADYEWGLRVSLFKNVIHVPYYLATWRMHDLQATSQEVQTNPDTYNTLVAWVKTNLRVLNREGKQPFMDERQLTRLYRKHQQYYGWQKIKLKAPLLFRVVNRYWPGSTQYLQPLAEARAYFLRYNLNSLIKVIN